RDGGRLPGEATRPAARGRPGRRVPVLRRRVVHHRHGAAGGRRPAGQGVLTGAGGRVAITRPRPGARTSRRRRRGRAPLGAPAPAPPRSSGGPWARRSTSGPAPA